MKIRRVCGEVFTYWVSSESEPGKEHCVRWLEPSCTCNSFAYKNRQAVAQTGSPFLCKHLEATRDMEWLEMVETVKTEQLSK